jgi:hypothetical protein
MAVKGVASPPTPSAGLKPSRSGQHPYAAGTPGYDPRTDSGAGGGGGEYGATGGQNGYRGGTSGNATPGSGGAIPQMSPSAAAGQVPTSAQAQQQYQQQHHHDDEQRGGGFLAKLFSCRCG